jgi:hypothetical protein
MSQTLQLVATYTHPHVATIVIGYMRSQNPSYVEYGRSGFWEKCMEYAREPGIAKGACEGGHVEIIRELANNGDLNENKLIFDACKAGNMDIINILEDGVEDWDNGLCGACEGGHLAIVDLAIANGAGAWNDGLRHACLGGKRDAANRMISCGASNFIPSLWAAFKSGCVELVDDMIARGAPITFNYDVMHAVYETGNPQLIQKVAHLVVARESLSLDAAFTGTCRGGHFNKAKEFLEMRGPSWCDGMTSACEGGRVDIVRHIIGLNRDAAYWDLGLENACEGGHIEMVEFLLDECTDDMDLERGLSAACKRGYEAITDTLIAEGADPRECDHCHGRYHEYNHGFVVLGRADED